MFRIRLRMLREEAGYRSQKSFADVFGVAQTTVAGWEGGKREPNYDTTMKLADFFHVSIDFLLGHTDSRTIAPSPISLDSGINASASFTEAECTLIRAYRAASSEDQAIIDNIVRRYAQKIDVKNLA